MAKVVIWIFLLVCSWATLAQTTGETHTSVITNRNFTVNLQLPEKASSLSLFLQTILNQELGFSFLRRRFQYLKYVKSETSSVNVVDQLSERLLKKVQQYSRILSQSRAHVESLLLWNTFSAKPVSLVPCCNLDYKQLNWDEHFQRAVSRDFACEVIPNRPDPFASAIISNVSEQFRSNLVAHGSFKWQFFISQQPSLLHIEYPASRLGSQFHCVHNSDIRHRDVYLSTIHPHSKHVFIVWDHGSSMTNQQLDLGRAVVQYIVSTLTDSDFVGLVGAAGDVEYPIMLDCPEYKMVRATQNVKYALTQYISDLTVSPDPTDHVGAFDFVTQVLRNSDGVHINTLQIVLVTQNAVFKTKEDKNQVFSSIASMHKSFPNKNIVINCYDLVDLEAALPKEVGKFLEEVANQDYEAYDLSVNPKHIKAGQYVQINSTVLLAKTIGDYYLASDAQPKAEQKIFPPEWDPVGSAIVVSFTQPVFKGEDAVGVIGFDVDIQDLLEEFSHFDVRYGSYPIVIEKSGRVIYHPLFSLNLAESNTIDITDIEENIDDMKLHLVSEPHGQKSFESKFFTWKHVSDTPYIVVLVSNTDKHGTTLVLDDVPMTSSSAFQFHDLDLVSNKDLTLCRHFRSVATLDFGGLFLSPSCFNSPYLHTYEQNSPRTILSYMAYLKDTTGLLTNPGLKDGIRNEAAAIVEVTNLWKNMSHVSGLNNYIVRRFVSTPSGVFYIYPGSPLPRHIDPVRQPWYLKAIEFPDRVAFTPPRLDSSGAGYIVTLSHAIQVGGTTVAVTGIDLTLGYLYNMISDALPVCHERTVECFLIDDSGYLVTHSSMVDPTNKDNIENQHLTHREPLIANDILNHDQFVHKKACKNLGQRTVERFYEFNTTFRSVLTNLVHGEVCSRYQIVLIPGTNVFLGVVNVTCSTGVTAFCPCSISNTQCFVCPSMQSDNCECPCECSLVADSCNRGQEDDLPVCRVRSRKPRPLNVNPMAENLPSCFQTNCKSRSAKESCFGVIDCEWCEVEEDGSRMEEQFCSHQSDCFGGRIGATSPYDIRRNSRSDDGPEKTSPIGPIAGGIMAFFFFMALSVYCYKSRSTGRFFGVTNDNSLRSRLEPIEVEDELRELDTGHQNAIALSSIESVSPYRMNPGYRRPPPGTDSDHGYSTMTPMGDLDSEIVPYTDSSTARDRLRHRPPPSLHSVTSGISSRTSSPIQPGIPKSSLSAIANTLSPVQRGAESRSLLSEHERPQSPIQTVLSPNKIIVSATVHMVDSPQ